jgi:hypothetical protein
MAAGWFALLATFVFPAARITDGTLWFRSMPQFRSVADGRFLAGIEFKSQVGSFGNNYNNRTEESIGSAVDLWAAYREGAFEPSARPWLGYLMLLEEAAGSIAPVTMRLAS